MKPDSSEMEDFKKCLKRYGYSENDFEVLYEDTTDWPNNGDITQVTKKVTVTYKINKKHKTYSGRQWVTDVDDDFKNKSFP